MPSTQDFLQFDHIREGVIVLRDGSVRAILRVSPVNFGLKSRDEQDAITYAFQDFLNSLDFDLQTMIHSQKMNIDPYLEDLRGRAQAQENELLRTQTEEYIDFIRSFVATTNIVAKEFYLVVPFTLLSAKQKTAGPIRALPALFARRSETVRITPTEFETEKSQLQQRVEFVRQNLTRIGLESRLLSTEEIVTLLWRLYNPEHQAAGTMPEMPIDTA